MNAFPQWAIVPIVMLIALLIGQAYPMLGALIATFPTKIVGYAIGSWNQAEEGLRGLLIGSLASLGCVSAMIATNSYGMWICVLSGLGIWVIVALAGKAIMVWTA